MALEATLPLSVVNVPGDFLYAGFQVTLYGRFWVFPEDYDELQRSLESFDRHALEPFCL
jgi:isocitrate dehydrogenase kinase/phosphatase